jgi:hypothetical protein
MTDRHTAPAADKIMRPEAHVTDTKARKVVPLVLPDEWEFRETTGRDYGVDMIVELFEDGLPLGRTLLFQIKGTEKPIDVGTVIPFDLPVNCLKYAELFVSPVLLIICPVSATPACFYYVWLQEYARIVLSVENPDWRLNKSTVRIHVPVSNKMPDDRGKLLFIANFPQRLFDWGQVGRIQHELQRVSAFLDDEEPSVDELNKYVALMEDLRGLSGIFGDRHWKWAQNILLDVIEPTIAATRLHLRNPNWNISEMSIAIGRQIPPLRIPVPEMRGGFLTELLASTAQRLSAYLAIGNDYRLKRDVGTILPEEHDY